jgi:hypothetical protein
MMNTPPGNRAALSQNRAEEYGFDVWKHFVIPPFFDQPGLLEANKPRVFIGGRGCGKTMLLRYLSHQTTFSELRTSIPASAASHIGLYWRADTQFANAMTKRDITDDVWSSAFNHMTGVLISIEVLASLRSIAASQCDVLSEEDLKKLTFERLSAFDSGLPSQVDALYSWLERKVWELESWVNDVHKKPEPNFLPGRRFVLAIIKNITSQLPTLKHSTFQVYLDEYENLCPYQQLLINTWLKHSEPPLIFNLAMKRNAFTQKDTTGNESLSHIHDYREHDLEAYLLEGDFNLFASEILLLNLNVAGLANKQVDLPLLRDPNGLHTRRSKEYGPRVIHTAQGMFPDLTEADIASDIFKDHTLTDKLRKSIGNALTKRAPGFEVSRFFRPALPEATTIVPALLHRKRITPEEIERELDLLAQGKDNRFTGTTDWIHNNFLGCVLQLYAPISRACPVYGGFRSFCQLSKGNIRHFLELCFKSISRGIADDGSIRLPISTADQAEAARQVSGAFLNEIKSFGRHGNRLHAFVLRLGSLFALAHMRPTQSEPEQNHFSVSHGTSSVTTEDLDFLREATKWSVLFETQETKKKDEYHAETVEYVLNPIYAPRFHISYRKRRKIDISTGELNILIRGSLDQFNLLMKEASRKWEVASEDLQQTFLPSFGGEEKQ